MNRIRDGLEGTTKKSGVNKVGTIYREKDEDFVIMTYTAGSVFFSLLLHCSLHQLQFGVISAQA